MLTEETIEALLKIKTHHASNTRSLRIMSCDNPIKELFVYDLKEIREEFNENPEGFEKQLALCIYKFDRELNLYLNNMPNHTNIKATATQLSLAIIQNAINEITALRDLIVKSIMEPSNMDLVNYNPVNYIALLQMCGLVDISNNVYRSKLLSRIINMKQQVRNYNDDKMRRATFAEEFRSHLEYVSYQLDIINTNKMYNEDFLVYIIMFDIRHYKKNRRNKMLTK